MIEGCKWDNVTNKTAGFSQYGYDGEDLIFFNPITSSWNAYKPENDIIVQQWDNEQSKGDYKWELYSCSTWLEIFLRYLKGFKKQTGMTCRPEVLTWMYLL